MLFGREKRIPSTDELATQKNHLFDTPTETAPAHAHHSSHGYRASEARVRDSVQLDLPSVSVSWTQGGAAVCRGGDCDPIFFLFLLSLPFFLQSTHCQICGESPAQHAALQPAKGRFAHKEEARARERDWLQRGGNWEGNHRCHSPIQL